MEDFRENCIEFFKDSKQATVTFTQGRYISRIKELCEKRPNDCKITHTNRDGSIVAHIPTSWIRINPNIELSEEEREKRSNRMKEYMLEMSLSH